MTLSHDEFGVLGPLLVRRGGRIVPITAAKHRIVLATLLLGADRSVPAADLIRRVWGEAPPDRAAQTIPVYVMRLRRALGEPQLIRTTPTGYRIDLPRDALDLHRFTDLAERGAALAAAEDFAGAGAVYERALAHWRGTALADVPSESLHETEATALAEQRLRVTSELVDVKLRLGRCDEVIADLRRLTAQHPLRERFWSQLMVALYRADRQADALDAYRQASTALARELGVDPSDGLRSVHRAILTGDPALHQPAANAWAPVSQLPAPVGNFVGRSAELARVTGLLTRAGETVVVCGPPGVGKTAFATTVGHAVRDRYPDGQLYANLRGHSTSPPLPTAAVLARFLRAMGVRADRIPVDEEDLVRGYRARLRGRRVLITLDNAASVEQVLPLLPGEPGCSVVITSRNDLRGALRATPVRLDVLRSDEAWKLLARSLGPEAATAQFDAIAELARLCGYLPLALRIALGNLVGLPHADIESYVAELSAGDRLTALAVDNDDTAAVRRAFDLSYAALGGAAARLFRLAGLLPGPDFSAFGAAALLGAPEEQARRLLEELASAHLVQRVGPDRFALHDLLHDYAVDRAREAGEDVAAARERLFGWYLRTAVRVGDVLYPELRPVASPPTMSADAARAWLTAERASVLAATEHCASAGSPELSWRLVDAVSGYFGSHGHHVEFVRAIGSALRAARAAGDRDAEVAMLVCLAAEHRNLGNLRTARAHLREAAPTGPARWLHAALDGVIGLDLADFPAATAAFTRLTALGEQEPGNPHIRVAALGGWGALHLVRGEFGAARERLTEGLALARASEGVNLEAACASLLARCHSARGEYPEAVALLRQALADWYRSGSRHSRAEGMAHLAAALCAGGEHAEALRTAQRSLALVQELGGSPRIEAEVHLALGVVLRHLGKPGRAVAAHVRGLELATSCGYRYGVARSHVELVRALALDGRRAEAARHARAGLDLARRSGFQACARIAAELAAELGAG
ncbi:AfsR/SARP family transcriptional regulator [Saccharothrix algeriensis]|uniref:DNA-binding SARP family transcriptional activator n=1 Tax=Saccharothrix algeriensis TaxID=173560 RepID=A0A8T8HVF7_9PSEU|nr:AfsR/SARP family transcriptional regulator [Saccharothrix algeriensis]MBM7813981.1 DNA-binding SARP family transcriptional activator [Saccharothrix algeriensis]QTR02391.1 tetratricopeptide repeat protein [Saccharothrix algeriensis]